MTLQNIKRTPLEYHVCIECEGDGFVWSLITHLQELCPHCAGMGCLEVIELQDTEHAA